MCVCGVGSGTRGCLPHRPSSTTSTRAEQLGFFGPLTFLMGHQGQQGGCLSQSLETKKALHPGFLTLH